MKRQLSAIFSVLCVLASAAFGQGWNVDLVSETYDMWGDVMQIAKQGNYVYLGLEEQGLSVVNISTLNSPYEVARILDGNDINNIEVAGNYAYVASGENGLRILDISNPNNPTQVANVLPPISPPHTNYVCLAGNLAYVIYAIQPSSSGLEVVDVTVPTDPEIITHIELPGNASDPTVSGNYLYIPSWAGGLWIYDISTPASPILTGALGGLWGAGREVAVSGSIAYLTLEIGGLGVINVSDPANPTLLSTYSPGSYVDAVSVSGNLAYVGTISDGLYIADIANPAHLVTVGNYAGPYSNSALRDMVVESDHVYGAWDQDNLRVTDVSNPANPTNLVSYYADWDFDDIEVRGDYAYIAAESDGLLIENISNPAGPWQVSLLGGLGTTSEVKLYDDYAYVQTAEHLLRIVDISDLANPTLAATYPLWGGILQIAGNLAYVSARPGLRIWDLTVPTAPVQIGTYAFTDPLWGFTSLTDMALDGQYLYGVALTEGSGDWWGVDTLIVLNVGNPANPQLIGKYDLTDYSHKLALSGDYLYIYDNYFKLRVFNVSNPAQVVQVNQININLAPTEMYAVGNYLYFSCSGYSVAGPRIMDLADPVNPVMAGYYMAPTYSNQRMGVQNNYAYVTEGQHFAIYDCNDAIHNQVEVTLTPLVQPIQIPANGGSFDYYLFVDNAGPDVQQADLWAKVILPGGSTIAPVVGPYSATLDSGVTGWLRHQSVPATAPAGFYSYIVLAGDYPNGVWSSDTISVQKLTTGDGPRVSDWTCTESVIGSGPVVSEYALHGASPNPFNPTTVASYELRVASQVSLRVYDTAGRLVATLVDGMQEAGQHSVTFDGSKLTSGIYIAQLTAGEFTAAQKLVLVK